MKKLILFLTIVSVQFSVRAQIPSYITDYNSFSALTLEGGQTEIEFADINNDGHLDLLTVGDHGSPLINSSQHGISVFFGNGTGSGWTLYQNGDFGYGGIAVGDVNNDGFLDVGYGIHHNYSSTDFGDQLLEVALGDGTGMNWTPWDDSLATAGETWGMFGTDFGDFNNDGLLDIVSGSFGCCAGTHVYLNSGTGVWNHSFGYINGNTEHYVECGDINHDGNLDFVSCHQNGAAYFGDGTGNFTNSHFNLPPIGPLGFYDISLKDIDGDGDDDFGFIHNNSVPYVYKWDNVAQQWVNSSAGLTVSGLASCIKLSDLNNDGFADAVVATTGSIVIFLGNGGTVWNNVLTIPLTNMTFCQDIAIADADQNGYPEIAVWATFNNGPFSTINKLVYLREVTPVTTLNINQTFPKGFECMPANAVRNITWNSSVIPGHQTSVKIEFSSTGLNGTWSTVAATAPNNGNYQWNVPSGIISYNSYIRTILTDSTAMATDTAYNLHPFQIGVCDPALSVSALENNFDFDIAPNPFSNTFRISAKNKLAKIEIYNTLGNKVFSEDLKLMSKQSYEVKPSLNSNGIYFIKLTTVTGEVKTMKIVRE